MARPYYTIGPQDDSNLDAHQVLLRPLVTEKGVQASEELNSYAFEIAPNATKLDVRRAVEQMFNVKVKDVRTQNRKGKTRRYRYKTGTTSNWKKAIVTLTDDHRIDFF